MAKSITQAMLGILVAEGRLDVFAPAEVPEWAEPDDPRHPITIDTMLHMRSGLEWVEEYEGTSDVIEMLFGEGSADRAHFAADRPLAAPPGDVWNYSTGTSMILSRIIADQVGYFEEGTQWAQDELFGPLGITSVVHDLDDTGVMSGGSAIDMTALDFARFGLLYLRGGEWDGDQIVPEAWVDYARMPVADVPTTAPTGGHAGTDERFPSSFAANGFNGQSISVVPELDLVVVVLANEPGARPDLVGARVVQAFGDATALSNEDSSRCSAPMARSSPPRRWLPDSVCSPRPIAPWSSRSSSRSMPHCCTAPRTRRWDGRREGVQTIVAADRDAAESAPRRHGQCPRPRRASPAWRASPSRVSPDERCATSPPSVGQRSSSPGHEDAVDCGGPCSVR